MIYSLLLTMLLLEESTCIDSYRKTAELPEAETGNSATANELRDVLCQSKSCQL